MALLQSLLACLPSRTRKLSPTNFLSAVSLVFSLCVLWPALVFGAAPPTGENAYCGKGNVPHFGDKDGLAELPRACYYTALDGTPSPGKQIRVAGKADLGSAIDHATCGDTLLLPAGSSFDVKEFPAKKCDDEHYITIRTDTRDPKLPPGGLASLPHGQEFPACRDAPPLRNPPMDRQNCWLHWWSDDLPGSPLATTSAL
jgi:hypothetical protein